MKSLIQVWGQGWSAFLILALLIFAAGCDNNGGITTPSGDSTVLEIIQSKSNLHTFAGMIEGTTLATTFSGSGQVTVFAPIDAAFARLEQGYMAGLTPQQKLDILKYHVHSGTYPVINEIKKETLTTLHGDPLFVEIGQPGGSMLNGQARFVSTNIEASNGMVHVIDVMLLPDAFGTMADNIAKRYDYRLFYEKIESAGLLEELKKSGNRSVLISPDAAIEGLETQLQFTLSGLEWQHVMKYHLLKEDISGYGPGTATTLATVAGDSAYVSIAQGGQYKINGASVTQNSVSGTNGNLVFVEGVMIPDIYLDVLTVMSKRFNLTGVRSAFGVARLTGTLYNADKQFTVFVPRNDVPGISNWPTTEPQLANVLKYHVLNTRLIAGQVQGTQTYTTWQGATLSITKAGNTLTVNDTATVTLSDLQARNGVVHVINGTLTPPAN